jgi:hypothetical protein
MVGAGEMNRADLAGVLQTIAQQQTAIFQQQAALLQVHNETVRLQRLVVEHMLGNQEGAAATIPAPVTEHSQSRQPSTGDVPSSSPAPATPTPVPTETPAPLPPAPNPSPTPVAAEPVADAAPPAGAKPVADSGCSRTRGRCCTARSASRPTAHRKCAACRSVLPADVGRTLSLASLATGSGADAQTARDR